MYLTALLLMSTGDGQVEQIARTFGVDWPHLVAQIISFSIVCVLLQRFAYKPVLNMLAERRTEIAQSLADSAKSRRISLAPSASVRRSWRKPMPRQQN